MLGALEYLAVPAVGVLVWHEARAYGKRVDDNEWIEAAPVLAGIAICLGYILGGELTQPVETAHPFAEVSAREMRRWTISRGATFGTIVTITLLGFEAVLDDEGIIEKDWQLFEPLRFSSGEGDGEE